jgi:starch synthase
MRACAGLIVATKTEEQRVCQHYALPPDKIARIFNPIDLSMWKEANRIEARTLLGIPPNARVAVWHGRIDLRRKGLDILLDAWQQVCHERTGKELLLLLIGSGNNANELRQCLRKMQFSSILWVDDYLNDRNLICRYLKAADVYVFPSRHEGFPVAPIEAMACGLPLVAASAPGVPDILEGGEISGGLMVPRNDSGALASALGSVLDNPDWSRELGRRAKCRAEACFSLEAVGTQLHNFIFARH